MSALGAELVRALAAELADDPVMAESVALAVAPYLPGVGRGWLGPQAAADYLGLGSLDALDRLVRAGLPCSQPSGPGGRRYFAASDLNAWVRGAS